MNRCIYPGSFDPITYGHLDIINRACATFDEVIVAIGVNPAKKYTFKLPDRINFIRESVRFPEKVRVMPFDGLLADFAYEQHVHTIIKGVRNQQDFDYERLLHEVTITQQAGIDTHILVATPKYSHISSSAAKDLCRYQGLTQDYVPLCVKEALEWEINKQFIVGITGEIGMGKSHVTSRLVEYYTSKGLKVFNMDLDAIAHSIYTTDIPVYRDLLQTITDTFGLKTFDRKKLGEIVFNDPTQLEKLNQLTRQPILTLLRKSLRGLQGLIFLNGALLVESNFLPLCNNNVIVVDSSREEQMKSLQGRNLNSAQIDRRLRSQMTNSEKIEKIQAAGHAAKQGKMIVYTNSRTDDNFTRLVETVDNLIKSKQHA